MKTIEIRHFKSIEQLKINAKRINVFIGEPNTGKSNILEAIGVFSLPYSGSLKGLVRFENMSDLFFEKEIEDKISVQTDEAEYSISHEGGKIKIELDYNGGVHISCVTDNEGLKLKWHPAKKQADVGFKFYKFKTLEQYKFLDTGYLIPPYGENLLSVLKSNEELQEVCSGIFQPLGYKLWLRPHEGKIDIVKASDETNAGSMEVVVSHPYALISDTFQRLVFYMAAIETNQNSFLIFEEPEVKSFPFYSKFLAERIALDPNNNQYFLSTHNPYFLLSLLEKSKINEIGVFITYNENYKTRLRQLSEEEMAEVLEYGIDVFFNILRYIENEG
ncbi:MAG: AAA family ATPase [Candidatus Aminicenantes bacterium]|nr:AAA family ATPase [Candidatus Aminicenantes bacterium]NIM78632.1 AAA family ATPase [Candidatus Aminicenantes bacterium]NIN17879.1 AAA family ATPase [Candidatus Aminicenantes bacterium]NIN41782.1 AAA family ATPase [Candidatus Aminicenantes bacterium]NIN84534.1 AAA family ATPase [Candidatus Aminicenantes bacterium]